MKRKTFLGLMALTASTPLFASCASSSTTSTSSSTSSSDSSLPDALVFDPDGYEEKTEDITLLDSTVTVTYHQWTGIVYVTNPVDPDYQCMNIKQPISINGKKVDTSKSPIIMALNIGGYMSYAPNKEEGRAFTPPAGAGGMNGLAAGAGNQVGAGGVHVSNGDYALAHGFLVVDPGARGRDNQASDGTYYGKAPAAIVDLKSAVRYLRANADNGIPGNVERIVCTGSSAGGALSALLGASGDSPLYDEYLQEAGAAEASDAIYGAAPYCPITDLEHADAAYEWAYGTASSARVTVDQTVSDELAALYPAYVDSLGIDAIKSNTLADTILAEHIIPAANSYLAGLSDSEREEYLAAQSWITYENGSASFGWSDYIDHIGRSKSAPAFDTFDLTGAENIEFGSATVNARHFTEYSAHHEGTEVEQEVLDLLPLMNPMHFILDKNSSRSKHWFMRVGAADTDTSPSVLALLGASAKSVGDQVDIAYYWDQGHGTNTDPDKFIEWVNGL